MGLRAGGGGGAGEVWGEGGVAVWLVHHANTAHHALHPQITQPLVPMVEIFTFSPSSKNTKITDFDGRHKKEDIFSSLNENFHKLRHTAANFCNFITGPEILKFCGHNQLLNCRFVARNFVTARRLGAAAEGRVCDGAMRRRGNRRQCALAAETTEPAGNIAAKF